MHSFFWLISEYAMEKGNQHVSLQEEGGSIGQKRGCYGACRNPSSDTARDIRRKAAKEARKGDSK